MQRWLLRLSLTGFNKFWNKIHRTGTNPPIERVLNSVEYTTNPSSITVGTEGGQHVVRVQPGADGQMEVKVSQSVVISNFFECAKSVSDVA